ncbi:hypothetical protein B0H10DRAFT_39553 [Mycena sp. CBHHK59/15]|nr:hypothetical protein B0H10DRAFT_39553 [Mycena sp. CBHHK59/15]
MAFVVHMPDEIISSEKPLLAPGFSSSTYLLVCKDWLRVATPLLYHTVVLRTKAQSETLQAVLQVNKPFGLFIKKLRVEGGFGPAMHTILAAAPNVTDLFFTLQIWGPDNATGLARGMSLINPRRLILMDGNRRLGRDGDKPKKNKQVSLLIDALVAAIPTWNKLTTFDFPYVQRQHMNNLVFHERAQALATALGQSSTLETLFVPMGTGFPDYLRPAPTWRALKAIEFKRIKSMPVDYAQLVLQDLAQDMGTDPALKALVQFPTVDIDEDDYYSEDDEVVTPPEFKAPEIAPPANPDFIPMQDAPQDVREAIWKRVLSFAMAVENYDSTGPLLAFVLVSKMFKELALPYLYEYPALSAETAVEFARQLKKHPALGAHIHLLAISGEHAPIPDKTLLPIISAAPNLRKFGGLFRDDESQPVFFEPLLDNRVDGTFSYKALEMLGKTAGGTLIELAGQLVSHSNGENPAVWAHYTALRELVWESPALFNAARHASGAGHLSRLESLRIEDCSPSFLALLTNMDLDALQRVSIPKSAHMPAALAFLQRHAGKLRELRAPLELLIQLEPFSTCPQLASLVVLQPYTSLKPERRALPDNFLSCDEPHTALTKIYFSFFRFEKQHETASKAIFRTLDVKLFPALREIQVMCCKWPTSERWMLRAEIAKNKWVQLAELVLPKNVMLTDDAGVGWTPRAAGSRR